MQNFKPAGKLLDSTKIAAAIVSILACGPGLVLAQESLVLEEIVVVARKIDEALQDTPIAVSAFTQERLGEIGLETLSTISTSTPNLQIQRSAGGDSSITACMRGMCRTDNIITEEQMVGTYIDGFYIPKPLGSLFELLDVQQIEVLRGPQGTLFGKNTVGGAILVNTVRPSNEVTGNVTVNFGSDDLIGGKASVNVPLIEDRLAARVSLLKQERDGLVKNRTYNDQNDRDVEAARIALAFTPTDQLTIDYSYDWLDQDQAAYAWQLTAAGNDLNFVFPGITDQASENFQDTISSVEPTYDQVETSFHALTITWETDLGTFKSLSGWRDSETSSFRGSLPYYFITGEENSDVEFFSQEVQYLNSFLDDKLNLVVGIYASNEDFEYDIDQQFGLAIPATHLALDGETDSWAIFSEVSFQITEEWSASLGGRYTEEEKTVNSYISSPLGLFPAFSISEFAPENDFDTDNFAPRATLRYQPNDDLMYYASYSVGYKSGGLNGRATQPADFSVYDDAKGTSYELGIKSELFERRLRLNAALFYQELEDWQIQVNGFDPNTNVFLTRIENAAEANMTGAELEATFLLTTFLELSGSLGWIDTEYDEYLSFDPVSGEQVDVSDIFEFQFAPEWTYNLSLRYEGELADAGTLMARLDWAYVDNQYFVVNPSPIIEGDDYQLLDARIELRNVLGSAFTVSVWGKNITDEEYRTGGFDVATLGITGVDDDMYANSWGSTRTWGADIRYDW